MIKLDNISKIYNIGKSNEVKALKNLSLTIHDGENIAITGASGSGKSTLLNILSTIDTPTTGNYYFDNVNVNKLSNAEQAKLRNSKIGLIVQDYALIDELSALQNVMLPLLIAGKTSKATAIQALKSVELSELIHQEVSQMSGGQRQRVAIARSMITGTKVLLADEPTGALDSMTTKNIMQLLFELNKNGITLIMVTHDKGIASMFQRKIELRDGMIVE